MMARRFSRRFQRSGAHVRPRADEQFAHPAERDFSSILSYYRVRWAYEPTSFPLEWGSDGRPSELFTPDFYLPDLRLYVELTTMRQRLVTRKNKKLRRLRELYPDIRIKLLYRRDYHQFVDLYLRPKGTSDRSFPGSILFSGEQIAVRIDALAGEIAESDLVTPQAGPLLAMVGAPGANQFAAMLGDALAERGIEIEWESVRLTRANRDDSPARVRLRKRPGHRSRWSQCAAAYGCCAHRDEHRLLEPVAASERRPECRALRIARSTEREIGGSTAPIPGVRSAQRTGCRVWASRSGHSIADFDAIHTLVPVHEADEDAPVRVRKAG